MKVIKMGFIEDEAAQSSAEYLLIFGGIIVIVLIAIIVYRNYTAGLGKELVNGSEIHTVENSLQDIISSFS